MVNWITNIIEQMGYIGVSLLTLLEVVFPPIPSEIILPFSGFTAARSDLTVWGVTIAGTIGSVVGAVVLYYIGYSVSPERLDRWVEKHGRWLLLDVEDVEKARDWFSRHGNWVVLFGRLVPGVRSLVSIPAGNARMNIGTFLLWTTIGTAGWSFLLTYVGNLLGANYQQIGSWLSGFGWIVAAIFVGFVVWWVWHKNQSDSSESATS